MVPLTPTHAVRHGHSATDVLARLRPELDSPSPQARSQALHTLSKIGDGETWRWVTAGSLCDDDDEVARSAWRAAATLTPDHGRAGLARTLVGQLGRGDRGMHLSLSRALVALPCPARAGAPAMPLLEPGASRSSR